MATIWGATVQSSTNSSSSGKPWECRLGLDITTENTSDTNTHVTIKILFQSKWALTSSSNSSQNLLYFDDNSTSATSSITCADIAVSDNTSANIDSAGALNNIVTLATITLDKTRGSSAANINCAAKITKVSGFKNETITVSTTYNVPAARIYTLTYTNVDHVYDLVNGEEIVSKTITGQYDTYVELAIPAKNARVQNDYGMISLNNAEFEYQVDSELYYDANVYYTYDNSSCWKDSSNNLYGVAQDYYITKDETMTAQWIENIEVESVMLPTPTKEGYIFLGWSKSKDYVDGDELYNGLYEPSPDLTYINLYAQWQSIATHNYIVTKINNKWEKGLLYVKVNGTWKQGTNVFKRINGEWKHSI